MNRHDTEQFRLLSLQAEQLRRAVSELMPRLDRHFEYAEGEAWQCGKQASMYHRQIVGSVDSITKLLQY